MVLSESELSHQAASETLPLRDAFAVLFFVSVGMLFDPAILVQQPLAVLATLLIITAGKSAAAFAIVRAFRLSRGTALTISASLAQIGEFSFILAGVGLALGLMPKAAQDLILAGAILSILVNPLFFVALDRLRARSRPQPVAPGIRRRRRSADDGADGSFGDHRLWPRRQRDRRGAAQDGVEMLAIEERRDYVESARLFGIEVILGDAQMPKVLAAANIGRPASLRRHPQRLRRRPDRGEGPALNPDLEIVARAHSDAEIEHLGVRRTPS